MFLRAFIVRNFFEPPRHIYKVLFLNILGLQIFRIFIINLKYFLIKKFIFKPEVTGPENSDLEKNGFVVIENFLSSDEFKYIQNYFETLKKTNYLKKEKYGSVDVLIGIPVGTNKVSGILSNSNLSKYVSNVIIKKIKELPVPTFQEISLQPNINDSDDPNGEFHVDRHYPCCKAFYYINDNSSNNGSFEYISQSHMLTLKRLKFEYFYSIFSSTEYFDKYLNSFGFIRKSNRITLTDYAFKKYFGKIIKCNAPKNSLVICNNMGFHKRGKFLDNNTTRIHLRYDFYDQQLNPLVANAKQFLRKKFTNQ